MISVLFADLLNCIKIGVLPLHNREYLENSASSTSWEQGEFSLLKSLLQLIRCSKKFSRFPENKVIGWFSEIKVY